MVHNTNRSMSFFIVFVCLVLSQNATAFVCTLTGRNKMVGSSLAGGRLVDNTNTNINTDENENDIDCSSVIIPPSNDIFFEVLQDAIYLNSTDASLVLLLKINDIRENGDENGESKEYEEHFLNNLLAVGPDAQLPIWSRFRLLARFSRRARMASLRRTLDQIMPPPVDDDDDMDKKKDTVDSRLQRRRRALVSLLRTLSTEEGGSINNKKEDDDDDFDEKRRRRRRPAIINLEKKSTIASKDSATDLISRKPSGLETPDYEVISATGKDKKIEIRRYKPYSVCAVSMSKPRPKDSVNTDQKINSPEKGGASAFGALAGYLFGKNDQSSAMKMTTPVQTSMETSPLITDSEDRRMEFVLPSDYWGTEKLKTAPLPLEGSGVTLIERDSEERGVLIFGGYASKIEAEKRKKELLSALERDSKWKPVGNTERLAQYNDPFTMPWRRLNEVSVKVEQR